MSPEEMRRQGWLVETLCESVNWENMVMEEKGRIRLLKQRKLAYHQCINDQEGGGQVSMGRDLPKGVIYGVYLYYNYTWWYRLSFSQYREIFVWIQPCPKISEVRTRYLIIFHRSRGPTDTPLPRGPASRTI